MAYYVRAPSGSLGSYGAGSPLRPGAVFIKSAPLVMHDRCAHPAIAGDPWGDPEGSWSAREAFTAPMGKYFDLCWSHLYSTSPDAPPCYVCGERVIGKG